MERIFGFDIGTTSIGFAVIDYDKDQASGAILRLGARIFPEARDPKGTPLNQTRRQKRMARRQLRRRRVRRRLLNEHLSAAGLLPEYGSEAWIALMCAKAPKGGATLAPAEETDPYTLRSYGLSGPLTAHQFGRAIYHLAQHRHFRGRELDEINAVEESADERAAESVRESTLTALQSTGRTLGEHLAAVPERQRKRGIHANRSSVTEEFGRLWDAQEQHHPALREAALRALIEDTIFAQRPVFWRKNTLGECRFMPGEALCPKGSWLSQQRRMLEKLNNLAVADGNMRPLDEAERAAILTRLQLQGSMSWGGVREALKPVFKARGEPGRQRSLRFNLELGGEAKLPGNFVEAKLSEIFREDWVRHPHRHSIREAVHGRLWAADYGEIGSQRVVIRAERDRRQRRHDAGRSFIADFDVTAEQAGLLAELKLPSGWEPYSKSALEAFMPNLEAGVRFGALVNGPEWEEWRALTFPTRQQPTGEVLDRLPSPADRDEQRRISALRNPTVVRTVNELRKVVNNLIDLYGRPERIRVELAREVGKSKREREEIQSAIQRQERRRVDAAKDLSSKGVEPSRREVEKWLLWKESQERCPYTGDQICFDALFGKGEFDIEHIWPRSRSLDDSMRNKTLCRRDVNIDKGDQTPFEFFSHKPDEWDAIVRRLRSFEVIKGGAGMPTGKVKRFLADSMPDDFAARQLNDTSHAARQAVAFLKRLWPDIGPEAPVTVEAVTGRVTAQLRKAWGLNDILGVGGVKTRADHRHHAIDALVVACAHPGVTKGLADYWKQRDTPGAARPKLREPWPSVRNDAEDAVVEIVVSHRVRKKVSGPLHKETIYGDTGEDSLKGGTRYREFVMRKKVETLSKGELDDIRDPEVRRIVKKWVAEHGGDPKKAFAAYPKVGNAVTSTAIRKVRLRVRQQLQLMAEVSTAMLTWVRITTSPFTGRMTERQSLRWSACSMRRDGSRDASPSCAESEMTARPS